MVNIPFLRKLAAWLHILGWCYIIIVPPATMVSWVRGRQITADYMAQQRHGAALLPSASYRPFPWDDFTVAVLKSVAVGVAVLVLAQLVGLGIRALEHLRNLDGGEGASAEPTEEPVPAGIGSRILTLPGRFPSLRLLSRVAMVLGWAFVVLTVVAVALNLAVPSFIPAFHWSTDYQASLVVLGLIRGLAAALGLLLISQGLLWANEAVGHLKGLAEWEEEEEPEGEEA